MKKENLLYSPSVECQTMGEAVCGFNICYALHIYTAFLFVYSMHICALYIKKSKNFSYTEPIFAPSSSNHFHLRRPGLEGPARLPFCRLGQRKEGKQDLRVRRALQGHLPSLPWKLALPLRISTGGGSALLGTLSHRSQRSQTRGRARTEGS